MYRRDAANHPSGLAPPESRLYPGMLGGVLVTLSLFLFSATSMPRVHWAVPLVMSVPFGTGVTLVFTAVFTFLVE